MRTRTQGRMWEDVFKEMGLPDACLEKLKFQDGYPKVRLKGKASTHAASNT